MNSNMRTGGPMEPFKLIKQLGLEVTTGTMSVRYDNAGGSWQGDYVRAADLEALLAKGVRVSGAYENGHVTQTFGEVSGSHDTHTALLVCIEPIKRETANDILTDLIKWSDPHVNAPSFQSLIERAKRVLSKPCEYK